MKEKEELLKDRKKKMPFNVLKKGMIGALLGVTMLTPAALLTGCSEGDGSTAAAPVFLSGTEDPTSETGKLGDVYFETDDGDFWQFKSNGWEVIANIKGAKGDKGDKGDTGATGPQGIQGIQGTEGPAGAAVNGKDGNVWIVKEGNPNTNEETANVGDMYLDSVTFKLYQKAQNNWVELVTIKGQDGVGAPGERGATWRVGEGVPTVSSADKANDMYLDTANKVIYKFDGAEWDNVCSLETLTGGSNTQEILTNYYYTITTETELFELIEKGAQCFKLGADITLTGKFEPTSDLFMDLNNFTLNYESVVGTDRLEIHEQGEEGNKTPINVVFKNGNMNFESADGYSSIVVDTGCSISLYDVHYTSNTTALFPRGDTAKVEVVDSIIEAAGYAVGTNAELDAQGKPKYAGIEISLKDSILKTSSADFDNTAVMINVPGALSIENCEITGDRQALMVRGGNAKVTNSKLVCTGNYNNNDPTKLQVYSQGQAWGNGNNVPSATVVVGNNSTLYQYSSELTILNTDIISRKYLTPTIWLNGNPTEQGADFIGAKVVYDVPELNEDFMYSSFIGENVDLGIMVDSYEKLENIMYAISEGYFENIKPILAKDITNYDYELTVDEKLLIEEYKLFLQANNALNGYSIYTPAFDEMCSQIAFVESYEALDCALNTIQSQRILLKDDIEVTDATMFANLMTLVAQSRIIEYQNNKIILKTTVTSEAQLKQALEAMDNDLNVKVILGSDITITDLDAAILYNEFSQNIANEGQNNFTVTTNVKLTVSTENDLVQALNRARNVYNVNVKVVLGANITLTTSDNAVLYNEFSHLVENEVGNTYEVTVNIPVSVSSEQELIQAINNAQWSSYNYTITLTANITLTSNDSNNTLANLENAQNITLIKGEFEITEYIEYMQVYSANELINYINQANNAGDIVYVELMADITLESIDDNNTYNNRPSNIVIKDNDYTVTLFEEVGEPTE